MYQLATAKQNLSTADYLTNAKRTVQRLGWILVAESPTSITTKTPMAWQQNHWGELVSIEIKNDEVFVTGVQEGKFPFNGGRNREAVHRFLEKFSEVLAEPEIDKPLTMVKRKVQRRTATTTWWQVLMLRKHFYVTPLLLFFNIALFVEGLVDGSNFLQPTADDLLAWGASAKPVTGGAEEYWRMFTYMFVQPGIFPMIMNMLALAVIGLNLEPIIGSIRFAACYITTGLIAGLTSYWWNDNLTSAGASAAIFGLYGVFFVMLTTNMMQKPVRKLLWASIVLFITFHIAYGFIYQVDHAAHIGGLLSGILIGYLMYFMVRSQMLSAAWMQSGAAVAVAVIVLFIAVPLVKDPYRSFNRALKDFSNYEKEALTFYYLPKTTKDYTAISHLHDNTIPNWKRCKTELTALEKLKLPQNLTERKKLLHQYVDLHLKISHRFIDKLGEFTTKYDEEISDMQWNLENVHQQLYGASKQFRRSY